MAVALLLLIALIALIGGGRPFELFGRSVVPDENVRSIALDGGVYQEAQRGSSSVSVEIPSYAANARPPSLPAVVARQRHALLIGINNAPGARPLQGAVTDAVNVRQALLTYGFPKENVTTLLDGQATRDAILDAIDKLARDTPPTGVAVFAVAAHSRVYGGVNQLLAADGRRINAPELAARLARVRSRAWIALPTCFAGGYALPGIVGHNRIATFASSSNSESYELGRSGSYLIIDMVREAMIKGRAPYSVESAFEWARQTLEETHPNRVPSMSDGIDGDLVLGDVTWSTAMQAAPPPHPRRSSQRYGNSQAGPGSSGPSSGPGTGGPEPSPNAGGNRRTTAVSVCGNYRYNCAGP